MYFSSGSSRNASTFLTALADLFVGVVVIPLLVTKIIMIILEIPQHFCDAGGYYIREDIDLHWRCFA